MKSVLYKGETIPIYEYEDAERLIKELSDENAGDYTKVARGGRGRNKIEYYNFPCAFDIETTTIKAGELDYIASEDAPPIAFPYLFQWNIYGRVIMVRQYEHAKDIFKWLAGYFKTSSSRRLILFVHNLNFEYVFFKDIWQIEPAFCFALDEHHPVTIVTKDGLMFRDSFKMSNMSLETLTKDWSKRYKKEKEIMDYSILRTPYTELDDNTLLYSALDVLSLSEAIKNFLDARSDFIWTPCPTSTSFIRRNLKRTIGIVNTKRRNKEQEDYMKFLQTVSITPDMFKLLTRCVRGGNTHTNRAITGKILKDVVHFDVCSMYPTFMVCYPIFPISRWRKLDAGAEMTDIEELEENGYCTMFDMVLVNARLKKGVTVPYISISKMIILKGEKMDATDNGRYMGGLEQIEISIFGMEWDIIKRQYDFDDAFIIRGYFNRKGYLPDILRRFVLDLYEKKTTLKGLTGTNENGVEYSKGYNTAKAELNGVYGCCIMSPFKTRYEMNENGITEKEPEDLDEFLEKYQKSRAYFLPYAVGVVVAMGARCYLQRMIDAVGDNFVYCDTDSIFSVNAEESRKAIKELEWEIITEQRKCGLNICYNDIKGNPHELGTIDEEPPAEYFRSWGAKKYITVENGQLKCTVAGVPKKKGAEVIKTPERFNLGLNFRGEDTGKLCVWYNDAPPFKIHDEKGRQIDIYSNVAMLPCDYLLSLSQDYMECLSIDDNFHWLFNEAERNVINEE